MIVEIFHFLLWEQGLKGDNYNLRIGEITKWFEVRKYLQIYTLRNGNLYFTKWQNILYEMSRFLIDIRIYILQNENCMVSILKSILYEMGNNQVWKSKSILYEMRNNQVWKIKIYILRNELFLGVTFNNLHFTKSVINFLNLYFTKWAVDFQNLYFTKWPIIYKLYSWILVR